MKIYFNSFWGGFLNKEDGTHVGFFLELFTHVFNEKCELGTYESSEILCESLFGNSVLFNKKWKVTIFYSGESRLRENVSFYTIILCSKKSHNNIINCPVFVPYIYSNNLLDIFESSHNIPIQNFPKKDIIVIISNTEDEYRKRLEFIELLDKEYNITYAGRYKNNIGGILEHSFHSNEFRDYISKFKFVIAMENSIEETYITEKICHGINSKIIPIYWGTNKVSEYFNKDRYVMVDDSNYDKTLNEIKALYNDDNKWLEMVNQPTFKNLKLSLTIDTIAKDIQRLLY